MKGIIIRSSLVFGVMIIVFTMGLYPPMIINQTSAAFEPTVGQLVSSESLFGSFKPEFAIDSVGNIHIVWYDSSPYDGSGEDKDIFYKVWNSSTQVWGITQVISNTSTSDSFYPVIDIDSSDNVHIIWYDYSDILHSGSDADIFYKEWDSSVNNWSQIYLITEDSTQISRTPNMVIDDNDQIHIVWVDFENSYPDGNIFYMEYNPFARKADPILVSDGCLNHSSNPRLAVQGDTIHVVWYDYTDYDSSGEDIDILYNTCDQETRECGKPVVLSVDSEYTSNNPDIVSDGKDKIHIVWKENVAGGLNDDIFYIQIDPSYTGLEPIVNITPESPYSSSVPRISIDSSSNLHLVWTDVLDTFSTAFDVFYKKWDKATEVWSDREIISRFSTENSQTPSIEVDSNDYLYVAWSDDFNYYDDYGDKDIFMKSNVIIQNTETETVTVPGDIPNETITETVIETDEVTNIVNSTAVETTTVTDAKSELSLEIFPFLSALVLIPIIIKKSKNQRL